MKAFPVFFLFLLPLITIGQQKDAWQTFYEKSDYLETPSYEETISWCKMLDSASEQASYTRFGVSGRGLALPLLIIDKDGYRSPSQIRREGRIIMLVEACIHPGESEGKDAMMLLLRDMLIHGKDRAVLDSISILFIPVFNVDGHERFGPYNRINQNGPKEMGWRVNAANLNLNRDFLKADSPEMQYWLRMFNYWKPEFFIDCHTTDGADYQYVLTYALEIFGNMDQGLTQWQKEVYLPYMEENMFAADFPVFPYVSFRSWHDPQSGLISNAGPPMLSQGYTALRNCPGLLIETHMLKPYKPRVESTCEIILLTAKKLAEKPSQLASLIEKADKKCAEGDLLKQPFAVSFETSLSDSVMTEFLGIEYDVVESDLTGGKWYQYKSGHKKTFTLPHFKNVIPKNEVLLPEAYIIPPEWTEVIDRLKMHDISFFRLKEAENVDIEAYHFEGVRFASAPYEGRQRVRDYKLITKKEERLFPAKSVIVPARQPNARVVAWLLEPQAEGSLLEWGFFNAVFEQKEYAETYVMEKEARRMLAEDPSLRNEFEAWKEKNPRAAKSQWAQLNWFYMKTPYWDEQKDRYPLGRITDKEILDHLSK